MPDYLSNYRGDPDPTGGIVQSPDLNKRAEPTQRSIRDADMARDVTNRIIQAGRNRSIVNSRIFAKFNAERPYDSQKLENEGLGWKQNFTTKPLGSMVEKVAPRLVQAVESVKYLTNSKLSDKWENSAEKTERFREAVTKTIRTHRGWDTLLEDIAFNDAMFGYTAVACLDTTGWFPDHFQQDQFFLPDGTKQSPRLCQVAIFKEVLLPHELYARIKDREAATAVGYNLENAIKVINTAMPEQIRDRLNLGGTLEFWYQNAIRELTIGATYMAGANVVTVYHLLAAEVTGKVSHYQLAGEGLQEIFVKEDQFESMEDVACFFSYQKGNGTMHGSKGIGRELYELAGMIDRTRNEVVDRAILSGKQLVQGDVKRLHTFKMSIVGMTCIIPNGWEVLDKKIDGNPEPFLKLDAYFSSLADQLIGNVSPPSQVLGSEAMRSPAAWNLLAARDEEAKDVRISRFVKQVTNMVQLMQKRMCSKDCDDPAAVEMQKELEKYMTREELDELAACPVVETVQDLTPLERQMIVAIASEKKGNPLYNQRALEVEDLTARASADFADRVLLPANDPTEAAEQTRQQQLELVLLGQGQAVPVSPRDNHLIHLSVLMPLAQSLAQSIDAGQADTAQLEILGAHLIDHYAAAKNQGAPKEALAEVKPLVDNFQKVIAQMKQLDAQAGDLQSQTQQLHAESDAEATGLPPGL